MRVNDLIQRLPKISIRQLDAPKYTGQESHRLKLALAVKSMQRHMTDEGWQIMQGLEAGGYHLYGHGLPPNDVVNVEWMLRQHQPSVMVVQDKREWEGLTAGPGFDPQEKFINAECMAGHPDTFRVTILKDAQNNPDYHRAAAEEMGAHAWIVYYHPTIVSRLAPYVRPQHLIRTYHTVDATKVPVYSPENRDGCILSGAVSHAYPWRMQLVKHLGELNKVTYLKHPGYHRDGTDTPDYLKTLTKYKVAICTSSRYGYALRKIIEATAAGCIVVTDLPQDEILPEIDGNLIRLDGTACSMKALNNILTALYHEYDPEIQAHYAERAKTCYDYRVMGRKLAADIETMRSTY